jgi:hypothetical protein
VSYRNTLAEVKTRNGVRTAVQRLQVELVGGLGRTNFMFGRWTASAMASASF